MKKQDRRVARTICAIESAYLQLLEEKGSERITISEIARIADINRKTFYLHYNSVDDILDSIGERKGTELLDQIRRYEENNTADPVDIFFSVLTQLLEEDLPLYQQLSCLGSNSPLLLTIQKHAEHILNEAMQEYAALPDDKRIMTVKFYGAGIVNVYASWLRGEIDMDLTSLSEQIKEYVQRGIRL